MYLRTIKLRDWKAYAQASFDFPAPAAGKNIILIGAENGYGKTSLFEAVVLGLFGRDGLPLIARAPFANAGEERLSTSYKSFLERALNKKALDEGRSSCSVQLVFEDEDKDRIEIQRIWSFSEGGTFKPYDEDVQLYEGHNRRSIGPTNATGQDRLDWYRDRIAKTFLPYYLAAFFLFDGEQVGAFAEREMSAQVRTGIEGLLGLPVLRELADDLRNYARSKRQQSPSVNDATVTRLEQERDALKAQLTAATERLVELEPNLANLHEERERLTREVASFGAGTQAQLQEQLTQLAQHRKEAETGREKLQDALAEDISLALAGRALRQETIVQLHKEEVRESWERGREQGDRGLERFVSTLQTSVASIAPPLSTSQQETVLARVRDAWDALWYPAPDDCADRYIHEHLRGRDRARARERLEDVDRFGASTVLDLLDRISAHEQAAARLQEELSRTEAIAPQLDAKRERLRELNGQIEAANRELGSRRNEAAAVKAQLDERNKEIARLAAQMDQALPSIRRASRAERVAMMIDDLVENAVPSQVAAIGNAMTDAHKSMAHKQDLVDRIDIDANCDVRLLNRRGRDVRDMDMSAGEKQIFTQALISAVASVSGRVFPMVVDTPLGRLDENHRKGILRHLVRRKGQVVLLSTNTEVVGKYLAEIEPYVLKSYLIKHEQVGDVGRSWPVEGYF